jgi:hypothetical protein
LSGPAPPILTRSLRVSIPKQQGSNPKARSANCLRNNPIKKRSLCSPLASRRR